MSYDISQSMFRDPTYPSCDDVYVELVVYNNFDDLPENNIEINFKQKKGDVIESSLGRKRTATIDLWTISSDNKVNSKDARDHLDYILNILQKNEEFFKNIIRIKKTKTVLKCVWFAKGYGGGPVVDCCQLRIISDFDLDLVFSFYPNEW